MDATLSKRSTPAPPVRRRPRLSLIHSPGRRSAEVVHYPLEAGLVEIGRDPGAVGITLPGDPSLSRRHAWLEVNGTSVRVTDAGSRNGTFVNRIRLADSGAALGDGDLLRVGDSFFLLRLVPIELADAEVPELVGVSPAMAAVRARLARVAADPASVMLRGESGTGKEVAAHALHRLSGRSGSLVAVNCAAIPAELAESQFFGHAAGAFTGARVHTGFFRAAHLGTLFLDEVGDLPLALQPKLLRVLEERWVVPLGTSEPQPCELRLIVGTNRDLEAAVTEGRFREDLYSRLSDVVLAMPPLHQRLEDLFLLLERAGADPAALPAESVDQLLAHRWPLNVREVFKLASHLRLFGADEGLKDRLRAAASTRPAGPAAQAPTTPGAGRARKQRLVVPPREHLEALLKENNGLVVEVARRLGCSRRQVGRWLELRGIDRNLYRE